MDRVGSSLITGPFLADVFCACFKTAVEKQLPMRQGTPAKPTSMYNILLVTLPILLPLGADLKVNAV